MISDTISDGMGFMLRDLAHYMNVDREYIENGDDPLYYDNDTYVAVLKRLVPLWDARVALDLGCDFAEIEGMPIPDERRKRFEWEIISTLIEYLDD